MPLGFVCDECILLSLKKTDEKLFASENDSILVQFRKNSSLFWSPVFVTTLLVFVAGNFIVTFSLNIVNDMICRSHASSNDEEIDFEETQSYVEVIRVALGIGSCILLGLMRLKNSKLLVKSLKMTLIVIF